MSIIRRLNGTRRFFSSKPNYHIFPLGKMSLTQGGELPNAKLAYATYGELNDERSNAIIFPTCYSGLHSDNSFMVGEGRALDPSKYFIIIPSLFGNGESSSPSNTPDPQGNVGFPTITIEDNLYAQKCLVEHFDITKIVLVVGRNVGSHVTWLWKKRFPDLVENCATFGRRRHRNDYDISCFDAAKKTLETHPGFSETEPSSETCLRAFARSLAEWGLHRAFYKEELYDVLGFKSLNRFHLMWENYFTKKDPHDLLCMLSTWSSAVDSAGDLKSIQKTVSPMGPSFLACPFSGGKHNPSEVAKIKYSFFVPMPFRAWADLDDDWKQSQNRIDRDLKKILEEKHPTSET